MERVFKRFLCAAAVCGLLRLSLSAGVGERALALLREVGEDRAFTEAVLGLERAEPEPIPAAEPADEPEPEPELPIPESEPPKASASRPERLALERSAAAEKTLEKAPETVEEAAEAEEMAKTAETAKPAAPLPSPAPAERLEIKNGTSYVLDPAALLSQPLPFTLGEGPQVLILHTHGSEAYSQAGGAYEESDPSRTEDKTKSVMQVGKVLAESLEAAGLEVLHDTELYDYPSYTGSYGRSLAAVERALAEHPSIQVVLDIHRDAAATASGAAYRTEYVAPGGVVCSQLMLIAATGENGLAFPGWRENLGFALRLQAALQGAYPGLARPLYVAPERYNEHAAPAYLLVEVGTDGNTLGEAENAARLLGQCLAAVLNN